jgi:hypothetical protein
MKEERHSYSETQVEKTETRTERDREGVETGSEGMSRRRQDKTERSR